MADAIQYTVSLKEMTVLILKDLNIHEGLWTPSFGIQVGMGNFGPVPEQTFPGAAVSVANVGIQKVDPSAPRAPHAIIVDAAEVNSKSKKP